MCSVKHKRTKRLLLQPAQNQLVSVRPVGEAAAHPGYGGGGGAGGGGGGAGDGGGGGGGGAGGGGGR